VTTHLRNRSLQNNSRDISPLDLSRVKHVVKKGSAEGLLQHRKLQKASKKKVIAGTEKLLVKIKGSGDDKPLSTLKD